MPFFFFFFKTCLLVTWDTLKPLILLLTQILAVNCLVKKWSEGAFLLLKCLQLLMKHAGRNGGRTSRVSPEWPPLSRPTVLVSLLLQRGGYLFLHQPQLVAQVAVGFHEMLDFGLRGRERVLHLQVLLHCDGAVGEVWVQALLGKAVVMDNWSRQQTSGSRGSRERTVRVGVLAGGRWHHVTLVLLLEGSSWSVSSSDATLS